MPGRQSWGLRWLFSWLSLRHCVVGARGKVFRPLRLEESREGEAAGKGDYGGSLVHVVHTPGPPGSLDIYGFRLLPKARARGEILWASDWESLELDLCNRTGLEKCQSVTQANSANREGVVRRGVTVPAQPLEKVLSAVLRAFKVDIFHPSVNLHWFARAAIDNGPFATLDLPSHAPGETRFFNSVMSLMATMGQNIMLLSNPLGSPLSDKSWLQEFQQVLLRRSRPAPLDFCWRYVGPANHCENKSSFPEGCIITAFDYWGKQADTIHATPDSPPDESGRARMSLPISIASCYAEDSFMKNPDPGYVLLYGKAKRATWLEEVLVKASPLPVKVLTKHAECTYAHCINATDSVVEFHNVLRQARIVVAPWANIDNPALLEAVACGTPVVLETHQHQMLERYGSSPHTFVWDTKEDLLRGLDAALRETEKATNHKLQSWLPEPLRLPTMRRELNSLLLDARKRCDTASS